MGSNPIRLESRPLQGAKYGVQMDKPSEEKRRGVGLFFVFILALSFIVPGLFFFILFYQLGISYIISLGIVAFTGLAVGRLIIIRGMKAVKVATVSSVVLSVIFVLWVSWSPSYDIGGETFITATGFSKMKPQLGQTHVRSSGEFQATFLNRAGILINVTHILLNDTYFNTHESPDTQYKSVIFDSTYGDDSDKSKSIDCRPAMTKNIVPAGEEFGINLPAGCFTNKIHGESYYTSVEIKYIVAFENISLEHIDKGTLRGPVE
jgi:hypothetical protein